MALKDSDRLSCSMFDITSVLMCIVRDYVMFAGSPSNRIIQDVLLFPRGRGHKTCCDHTGELTKGMISHHETVLVTFHKMMHVLNDHLAIPIH